MLPQKSDSQNVALDSRFSCMAEHMQCCRKINCTPDIKLLVILGFTNIDSLDRYLKDVFHLHNDTNKEGKWELAKRVSFY